MLTRQSVHSIPAEIMIADRLEGKTLETVWLKRGALSLLKTDLLRINGDNYHIVDVDSTSYEVLKPITVWRA